jgi:RNA polymerase sigma factor (sigma-70 family)
MTDFNHIQLLPAFQKGDVSAFEQVFKLYYKHLRLQAFLILKNEEDAEDQVQQLFLDIWTRQLYSNVQQSLKAYLFIAIRNRCYNCFTKATRVKKVMGEYAETIKLSETKEYNDNGLNTSFQSVLNELPAQRFRAFHLVHIEDKKYAQAALEMGISINSLKSHLKLAVNFLKNQLQR